MPIICMFYGIIIRMYHDDHNPPHFHAEYQGKEALVDLEGNVLRGELPKTQMRMVMAWFEIHRDELNANWKMSSEDGVMIKIKPLE